MARLNSPDLLLFNNDLLVSKTVKIQANYSELPNAAREQMLNWDHNSARDAISYSVARDCGMDGYAHLDW